MPKPKKTFAERVLYAVEQNRGSWPQLAADADVTYAWLRAVMSGTIREPSAERLQRLADVLGVEHRQ